MGRPVTPARLEGLAAALVLGSLAVLGFYSLDANSAPSNKDRETLSPEAASSERTYAFSNDPEVTVLSMFVSGGLAMGSTSYALYGDGTLTKSSGSRTKLHQERSLAFVEMDDLVRIAVEGGLIGLDWPTLRAHIIEKHGHVPTLTDTPHLTLELRLDRYADSEAAGGPVSTRFSCVCIPAYLHRYLPGMPEVVALHELTRKLQDHFEEEPSS